ncbi:MAG: DUF1211 domain-containing protein [Methanoregulaceae archaeon]|nr:DUF1211 domain-containing protein [Methanoregulaceae archaeon]
MIECRNIERIHCLSDGVFAFALTLLVLSLQVPLLSSQDTSLSLADKLVSEWPQFFSYLISFAVIAAWWRTHHWLFGQIRRCDRTLINLNFLFLLCITIIPFLTNMLSLHGEILLATLLYAVIQAMAGFILVGTWVYASGKNRLIDPRLGSRKVKYITYSALSAPATFLISIPVAFFSTTAAQISWILISVFRIAIGHLYADLKQEAEEIRERKKEDEYG